MNAQDFSNFTITDSEFNHVRGNQTVLTIHQYGQITHNYSGSEEDVPRISQFEASPIDDLPCVTFHGDTLFHARLQTPNDQGRLVVIRRLAKVTTDEDLHEEIKHAAAFFGPKFVHLCAASRRSSPNKFLVYSNSITTYETPGEAYRNFDEKYTLTLKDALAYLQSKSVDGLTLDILFNETRTVNLNEGTALIVVPTLPSAPAERVKIIVGVLQSYQKKVQNRLAVPTRFTRCPECFPSTKRFYQSLVDSVLQSLENVQPHLEWARNLTHWQIQDEDKPEAVFDDANRLVEDMRQNTAVSLYKGMNDLLERSTSAQKGVCIWCGKDWDRNQNSPTASELTGGTGRIMIVLVGVLALLLSALSFTTNQRTGGYYYR
ncbi:hypothetical protein BDP27DRAFT_1337477 [Rhodocollybia butyracea]|uniref:Uncharacterized protein n=1 Tax=Rhodocollybia butyracea TaxID=206335 RepID=A0A9P5PEE4_9AGAR|nr:hypothetical protein BDP27DRAFT_1337477 [Rhodocollybia butyracea]